MFSILRIEGRYSSQKVLRLQQAARQVLGRTEIKQPATRSRPQRVGAGGGGWEEKSERSTSLPPEGARPLVGLAGRRGRREVRSRAGRGLDGSGNSRWLDGWGVSYVDISAQGLLVRDLVVKDT